MFRLNEFDIKINLENQSFEIYDNILYVRYVCRDFQIQGLLPSLRKAINILLKERMEIQKHLKERRNK